MSRLIDAIKWLMGLAKPDNLQAAVNLCGPPWVGYCLLTAIIFSETGLLIGFFLPGDSLLFAAGFLSSQGVFHIVLLDILLCVAAILGDAVNYSAGRKTGEICFEKERFRFVKQKHLLAAKAFYEKHGGKAIILARFMPIVRTFTPFVAGVAKMDYRQFAFFNIVGGISWVLSMTLAGYFLGQIPIVKNNFEKVVILIVIISVMPLVVGILKAWLGKKDESIAEPTSN